jgi:hypothetical protein
MYQLFFIPLKLAKLPWGLCPQTPEVFRFKSKLMSLGQKQEASDAHRTEAVGLEAQLWDPEPLELRFRRALSCS